MERIRVQFDGACKNVPGANCPMGLGVAVFINNEYIEELSRAILVENHHNDGTSNIGEWLALIEALKVIEGLRKDYPNNPIDVYGDSQLIVNQFNLLWKIKDNKFLEYFQQARELAVKTKVHQIYWLKRELNTHADELSKIALKLYTTKRYQLKGRHDESDSEWIEFESDFFLEVQKKYDEVTDQLNEIETALETYLIWDTVENKEVELSINK